MDLKIRTGPVAHSVCTLCEKKLKSVQCTISRAKIFLTAIKGPQVLFLRMITIGTFVDWRGFVSEDGQVSVDLRFGVDARHELQRHALSQAHQQVSRRHAQHLRSSS